MDKQKLIQYLNDMLEGLDDYEDWDRGWAAAIYSVIDLIEEINASND